MGAWGHDYFDNDGAQDLLCALRCALRASVEKDLRKIICRKGFDSTYYEEVIAASALIAQQGDTCGVSFLPVTSTLFSANSFTNRFFDLVQPAIEKLQKICADTDWLAQWNSSPAKHHAVEALWHRLMYMQEERTERAKRAKTAKTLRRKKKEKKK